MTNARNVDVYYKNPPMTQAIDRVCGDRRTKRLFRRCENPALPTANTLYATAKRLEYDGDIAGALDILYQAMQAGERIDSCMKDIAGLLNMMGRTGEAIEFLKAHEDKVTNKVGYSNLLVRLENDLARDSSDLPRGITIIVVDQSLGPVTIALCDRLFPNPAKIRRILYTDDSGYIGTVHFASHSSARKALQIQKTFPEQLTCNWANMYTEGLLRKLEHIENQPALGEPIACIRDPIPVHLGFGIKSLPIYRESDPSVPRLTEEEIFEIKRSEEQDDFGDNTTCLIPKGPDDFKSIAVSPISTVSTPRTTPSTPMSLSPGSTVLHEVLSNHRELFVSAGISVHPPYVTSIACGEGETKRMSAMVIPFPTDQVCESEISRISAYATALQSVASAMATVATLLETQRRSGLSPGLMHTPMKPTRGETDKAYNTPSPIIMRNMFT
jgi:hypothetical protein